MIKSYEATVIGGGMFGCSVALHLADGGNDVVILEKEGDLLQRASYANQARIHNGYHYPRSLLTALRSRVNYPRFLAEYKDCIDSSFEKYYAIAKRFSKVTSAQFRNFCERIGAPLEPAPPAIRGLFNPKMVEEVYHVEECAFDAVKLKARLSRRLIEKQAEIRLNHAVNTITPDPGGGLTVSYRTEAGQGSLVSERVFICAYSQMNQVLRQSGLPTIPVKHELTEIALVQVPNRFRNIGITVMDGPFFSTMPFPPTGCHTLSHVRYTPHRAWVSGDSDAQVRELGSEKSNYVPMIKDVQRYLPTFAECRQLDSLWEIKTVLPDSEVDDSRPILFKKDHGLPNLNCILGAKIDNIFDVLDELATEETKSGVVSEF